MTLPSSFALQELWYKDLAAVRSASATAASTFVATATKLAAFDVNVSGLKQEVVADKTIQTAPDGKPGSIHARRIGEVSFKMWLEGGRTATTSPGALATLLGAAMGGLHNPAAIDDAAEAGSTATVIVAAAHGLVENEGVLVGVVGDGRGGGKVSFVKDATATGAGDYELQLALPVAPNAADVLKNGHTLFLDYTDESYMDFLFVGSHVGTGATNDPDSVQAIGCSLSAVTFGGFDEGAAWVEMTFKCADWAWVAYASQTTFAHTTDGAGAGPVSGSEAGSLLLQDAGTTTRKQVAAGGIEITLPIGLQMKRDNNYSNGCGGWVKLPNAPGVGPTIKFQAYWADLVDMPGLFADSAARTKKQCLFQVGSTAQQVVAFYMQEATLAPVAPDVRGSLEESTALTLTLLGDSGRATDLSDATDRLRDASLVIWLG
jgi:hypothetical protein